MLEWVTERVTEWTHERLRDGMREENAYDAARRARISMLYY
jgi:hypothetical protein